jgi:hypothetical protein
MAEETTQTNPEAPKVPEPVKFEDFMKLDIRVANAITSLNQSYEFKGTRGRCAWTAGSRFMDQAEPPAQIVEE